MKKISLNLLAAGFVTIGLLASCSSETTTGVDTNETQTETDMQNDMDMDTDTAGMHSDTSMQHMDHNQTEQQQ